jgi:hypothetical protein
MTTSWNDRPKRDRIAHVGTAVVETPSHRSTVRAFWSSYERHKTRPEGTCTFVLGETRAGKSTACDAFMHRLAEDLGGCVSPENAIEGSESMSSAVTSVRIVHATRIERPVIMVQVDAMPTYNALFADVASAIVGTRLPSSWGRTKIVDTLTKQLVIQGTKMLIFDDVQHIVMHKGKDGIYRAADVFKVLMKAARVQVVLVGLPLTADIKRVNSQIDEMTSEVRIVRPFDLSTDVDGEFRMFLKAVEEDMPFDEPCDFSGPDTAARIHRVTQGYAGRISHLLVDATGFAVEQGFGRVDRNVLAAFLRDRRNVDDARNLFLTIDEERDEPTNGREGNDVSPRISRKKRAPHERVSGVLDDKDPGL